VMSLRDGRVKMSKSDPSDASRINLTDDADAVASKIRKARTDPDPLPHSVGGLHGRPEADNLVGLYAALADLTKAEVLAEFGGQGFGQSFKPKLTDRLVEALSPISAEMRRYMDDPAEVDRILAAGAQKARNLADPITAETKRLVGFWPGRG
jgi:tryptophanyl-tRNA synthetase